MNSLVEQDHRFIKRLVNLGVGFGLFNTAQRTLRGYEAMNMLRKGRNSLNPSDGTETAHCSCGF